MGGGALGGEEQEPEQQGGADGGGDPCSNRHLDPETLTRPMHRVSPRQSGKF